MKKLFSLVFVTFVSVSFANAAKSINPNEDMSILKNNVFNKIEITDFSNHHEPIDIINLFRKCRTFTVEVSVGALSISTDVTVCVHQGLHGGVVVTISKIGDPTMTGYILADELINNSGGKITKSNLSSVMFNNSNVVDFEGYNYKINNQSITTQDVGGDLYVKVILTKI